MKLLTSLLILGQSSAWSYTKYYTIETYTYFGNLGTSSSAVEVYPTGPVSFITSSVKTESVGGIIFGYPYGGYLNLTVTYATVPTSASVCRAHRECGAPNLSNGIETTIYAPWIITNKASCTGSTISYTTSSIIYQTFSPTFPTLFDQATDTGSNGPALLITTVIKTVDYNLGGQPILATDCTIWLKEGFVTPKPGGRGDSVSEDRYLDQCGDPRSYLCSRTEAPTCGGNYPPTAAAAATDPPGGINGGSGGSNGNQSGAAGRNGLLLCEFIFVGLTMVLCLFL